MTLSLAWSIKIGYLDTSTDFTDRVTGIDIDQPLGFMQPAAQRCRLTLNNFDGALTPGAGGTYSTNAWFEQAVFITCTINSTDTAQVFHGIITDFQINDDGITSTVELEVADWLSVGARSLAPSTNIDSSSQTWEWRAQQRLGSISYLPVLDQDIAATYFIISSLRNKYYAPGTVDMGSRQEAGQAVADQLVENVQPGVPSVIWPTIIEKYVGTTVPFVGTNFAMYLSGIVGDTLTRIDADATTFVFTEGTPAAGELPVGEMTRGFSVDNLYNEAYIRSAFTTNEVQATDASTNTIGSKTFQASESSMLSDVDTARMAQNIVTRFSNIYFMAQTLTIDSAQLADINSGSKEELAQLLDVRYGLWQTATVEYTPTGAATPTIDNCVIAGRQIKATPGRTTIALELLPAVDYQSFVLDSDVLGVLDQNRLG